MPISTNTKKPSAIILAVTPDGENPPEVLRLLPEVAAQYSRWVHADRLFLGKVFTCFEQGYHFALLPVTENAEGVDSGVAFIDTILSPRFSEFYLHAEGAHTERIDDQMVDVLKQRYRGTIIWQRKTRD